MFIFNALDVQSSHTSMNTAFVGLVGSPSMMVMFAVPRLDVFTKVSLRFVLGVRV